MDCERSGSWKRAQSSSAPKARLLTTGWICRDCIDPMGGSGPATFLACGPVAGAAASLHDADQRGVRYPESLASGKS